jgi:hypothetical protein
MEAFSLIPPDWTQTAIHTPFFRCPICKAAGKDAAQAWINRRSPVFTEDHRRKWQEFYHCQCGCVWWAWSSDRPPSELANQERDIPTPRQEFFNPLDDQ